MTLAGIIPTSWSALSIFALFGGLAIFMWGLEELSDGLKKAAGDSLKALLGRLTKSRLSAVLLGLGVTMMLQSSSATTVILVSLVQSSLLTAARTVGVIMGANIGTTLTGQLIAFELTSYSLAILASGFLARVLLRRGRGHDLAGVLVGIGLLFFGLGIMSEAMKPLRSSPAFCAWIGSAESLHVGLLVGAVFTAIVQSSAATTGIVISLASQGLLPLEGAIPVLLGANLGTCVTAILASLKASAAARRVAAIHVMFNVGGILLFAAWIPQFAALVRIVSPGGADAGAAHLVANAHTIFNVLATMVFYPLIPVFAKVSQLLLPDRKEEKAFPPIDRQTIGIFARAPDLALVRSRQALRLLGTALAGEILALDRVLTRGAKAAQARLRMRYEQCRSYAKDIAGYQADLLQLPLVDRQVDDAGMQAMVLNNLEPITRVLERDALPLALMAEARQVWFSEEGRDELQRFAVESSRVLQEALNAFVTGSKARAERALEEKVALRREMADAQRAHIERIREGRRESVDTDRIHMEALDLQRLILTYAGRIAEVVLE